MFLSSLICISCSCSVTFVSSQCLNTALFDKDGLLIMSFIFSLTVHRRLSEFLGDAATVGFKHNVVVEQLCLAICDLSK